MLAIGYCSFSVPDNESCPIDLRDTLVMGSRLIAGWIAFGVRVKGGGCVAEPRSLLYIPKFLGQIAAPVAGRLALLGLNTSYLL